MIERLREFAFLLSCVSLESSYLALVSVFRIGCHDKDDPRTARPITALAGLRVSNKSQNRKRVDSERKR